MMHLHNGTNLHYTQVLSDFKVEWEDYEKLQDADEPTAPKINDREAERKVIKWVPIFMDVICHAPLV